MFRDRLTLEEDRESSDREKTSNLNSFCFFGGARKYLEAEGVRFVIVVSFKSRKGDVLIESPQVDFFVNFSHYKRKQMSINDFAQALQSKDHTRYAEWFADDIRLYTPIHDEPTVGKETATQVLQVVFSLFENFQYSDVVAGHEKSHALIFRAKIGSDVLHGVDYLRMTRTDS